jgi:hypothetical protein
MKEDLCMFMLSVVINSQMHGWEGGKWGQWGLSKGTRNGAVDSEHGASKGID